MNRPIACVAFAVTFACAPSSSRPVRVEGARSTAVVRAPSNAEEPTVATASARELVERYRADRGALDRLFDVSSSAARSARLRELDDQYAAAIANVRPADSDVESQLDLVLLHNHVQRDRARQDFADEERARLEALLPYSRELVELFEARRAFSLPSPRESADALDRLAREVALARTAGEEGRAATARSDALRAARAADALARTLDDWHAFRDGYDPEYGWWCRAPKEGLARALREHAKSLRETVAGLAAGDEETIVGDPIGAARLASELAFEWIAYTPDELFAIGEREMAWCEREMEKAARDLGVASWREALELAKRDHVEPGEQPALVRDLALEAIAFLEANDLVTVPALAKETWRMRMMSPEAQRRNPFFLGGEEVIVSFPTDAMTHEEKLMSMRGNNRWFSRAVVHHELVPGHHLQQFMTQRHQPHRELFSTPFWTEGWALYWEMRLWDAGFARTPLERVGMLFWRMHRCARIAFSLGFHLGKMSEAECIELLVERVGHERKNAEAEVRRSFAGGYGPLYQCAYMIGGLQLRALHAELVGGGTFGERAFHDAVLQGGNVPIELVRARLRREIPPVGSKASWRF